MDNRESKADFLRECMSDPALVTRPLPIDEFCRSYCVVCGYKPCTRSAANRMLFTERVANWRSRMFTDVPRAAEDDPRYARIRAKNFRSLEEPLEVSPQEESPKIPEQQPEAPVHSTPIEPTEPLILIPPEAISIVLTQPQAQSAAPRQEPSINNTPFQGGIVLPGKPQDKGEDKFVEPGSTFTFEDEKP